MMRCQDRVHPSKITLAAQQRMSWHGGGLRGGDDPDDHLEEVGRRSLS